MSFSTNPFPNDPDRSAIWTILVPVDISAYMKADWDTVARDFLAEEFLGINANGTDNPDQWTLGFPTLKHYRDLWVAQARQAQTTNYAEDREAAIHRATILTEIEITGNRAVAHKKFDGSIKLADGSAERLNWQTVYYCRKVGDDWKLTGFLGYLPYPMGANS
jgi:hypothetical protein